MWNAEALADQLRAWHSLIVVGDELAISLPLLLGGKPTSRAAKFGRRYGVEAAGKVVHPTLCLEEAVRIVHLEGCFVWVGIARVGQVVPALVRAKGPVCLPRIANLAAVQLPAVQGVSGISRADRLWARCTFEASGGAGTHSRR